MDSRGGSLVGLRSLKGAVDAQKETIAAQKEFIQGLQTVLDATDTPKMLARIESYKKITDLEVEALKQDLSRKLAEEKNKMSQLASVLANVGRGYLDIIADLMPWAPIEERKKIVESADVPDDFKAPLHRWAEKAPDLSTVILQGRVSKLLQAYRSASLAAGGLIPKTSALSARGNVSKE